MLFSQQLRTFSYVKDTSLVLTPSDVGKIMAIIPSDNPNVAKLYDGSASMIPLGKMIAYNTNEVIIESTNIQKLKINNTTLSGSDYIITEPYIGSVYTTVTDLDPLQLVYPDSNGYGIAYSLNDTNKPTIPHLGYLVQSKSNSSEFLISKNLHFTSFSGGGGGSGTGENGLYNGPTAIRLGGSLIEDTIITSGSTAQPSTNDYSLSIVKEITDIGGIFNPKYTLLNYANFDIINASETTSSYRNSNNILQVIGDSDNDTNPGVTILEFKFNDVFINNLNYSIFNYLDITPTNSIHHISLIGNNLNLLKVGNLRLLDDYTTPDPTRNSYMAVDHNILDFDNYGNIETRNLIVNGGSNVNYGRLIGLNLNVYGSTLTGALNGDIFPIYQDYSRIDSIYTSGEYYIKNFFNSPIGIRTENPLAHLHIDCTNILYPTAIAANGGGLLITGDVGTVPLNYDGNELGIGTRFMWIPERKSLYVGDVTGSAQNSINIGYYNYNFGTDNQTSGNYNFVFGVSNTNVGYNGITIGSDSSSNDGTYNSIISTILSSIANPVNNSSIIGGVSNNINTGQQNTIIGGISNNINHTNSTISNSTLTKTLHSNSITYNGKDIDTLSTINGAQTIIPISTQTIALALNLLTTDATNITLPAETVAFFNIKIVARNTITNDTAQQFFRLGGYVDNLSVLQISAINNEFYIVPNTSAFVVGDITISTSSNELVITGNALNTLYYGTVEITYQTPI